MWTETERSVLPKIVSANVLCGRKCIQYVYQASSIYVLVIEVNLNIFLFVFLNPHGTFKLLEAAIIITLINLSKRACS